MTRLSAEDVLRMRKLHADGVRQLEIARIFKLHSSTVSRIVRGLTFNELPKTFLDSFWERVDVKGPDECWLWKGAVVKSEEMAYGHVGLLNLSTTAHRVAWELTNAKELPEGSFACHSCDTPLCCNPAHIFPGTPLENLADAVQKDRMSHIPTFGRRILTARQVEQIREDFALLGRGRGVTGPAVRRPFVLAKAEELGVAKSTIEHVVYGSTWNKSEANQGEQANGRG
jgi:hypothetical protein